MIENIVFKPLVVTYRFRNAVNKAFLLCKRIIFRSIDSVKVSIGPSGIRTC